MNNPGGIDFPTLFGNDPISGGRVIVNELQTLGGIIAILLPYIYGLAGILLMVYIISAGFSYLTAAGDPKKIQMAQAKLKNGFLGFLIIFVSYWIIQIIAEIFDLYPIRNIF